ncbi:sigma factor [Rubrivirga sp. S365]|uniref:Sigma factor n=1 Tax=Rubrivirga litoralis TaxID=3075598 RepID=A0ABU3BPB9_9BACT|nr:MULTISPECIES: sigma factor [unclassified Rubrivirga]MDT0631141.1 sigma factor [Rubrivirga sp. F394]MDT7855346.1 sigma factor [Rubrivirga sp. S365]
MPSAHPPADAWRRALDGDRDAFNDAIAPYQDDLMAAAARQLDIERAAVDDTPADDTGTLVDLTTEELVGETLVRAWERRGRYDADRMSFRAWLLGLQTRALARYARQEDRYAERKMISLDEELPTGEEHDAVEESFYEFRQPFDVDTYEEIVPSTTPEDVSVEGYAEADLSPQDRDLLADATFRGAARQVTVLHDEFEVSLPEAAQIINASLKDTAAMLNLAREGLLDRYGSVRDDHDDDPAVDSYTGDPLPDA